jgi:hypothetical protein
MRYFRFHIAVAIFLAVGWPGLQTAQAGSLSEVSGLNLPGVYAGGVEWGDLNDDGLLDLVLWGETQNSGVTSRILQVYVNNSGALTLSQELSLGVYHGDVALGDYNNDGKMDLAVSGIGSDDANVLALFKNETATTGGALNFTFDNRQPDISDPTNAVRYSALAWADFDKDGFLDLAVSGLNGLNEAKTWIYRNVNLEIRNELQRDVDQALLHIQKGDIAWADYDGDGDPDLVVNGIAASGFRTAKFFKNEPTGTLTEDKANSDNLLTFSSTSIAWGDFDNDGDPDLLQSGWLNGWYTWMTLQETGLGVRIGKENLLQDLIFNVLVDAPLADLAWGDIDNDGDLDISVMGTTIFSQVMGRVLRNDGNGTFTASQSFSGLRNGKLAWGDYDGDSDLDLIMTGVDENENRITRLLRNDETAGAAPSPPAELNTAIVTNNSVTLAWEPGSDTETDPEALTYHLQFGTSLNPHQFFSGTLPVGDGNIGNALSVSLDVQLRPQTYMWSIRTVDRQYAVSTKRSGSFTVQRFVSSEQQITDLQKSGMALGDVNNDGLPDLVIAGENFNGESSSSLYLNDDGLLKPASKGDLQDLFDASFAWADIDNDGDLDLAATGNNTASGRIARIYRNDSEINGEYLVYNSMRSQNLTAVDQGDLAWGDVDNDGDPDLALMGVDRSGNLVTEIYLNADGQLTVDTRQNFTPTGNGDLAWIDFDNDGDLDLAMTGETDASPQTGRLYRNSGGILTEDMDNRIAGLIASSLDWGDYDGDGDFDLLLSGQSLNANFPEIHIYRNDSTDVGAHILTDQTALVSSSFLFGLRSGAARWVDYDNDGDLDIVAAGSDGDFPWIVGFRNSGTAFQMDSQTLWDANQDGYQFADLAVADLNGDGDVDVLVSGRDAAGVASTVAYDNMEGIDNPNPAPHEPMEMTSAVSGSDVMLQWDEAFDEDFSGAGTPKVTYRLRLGTTPDGGEVISGLQPPAFGELGFARTVTIHDLASADYYWSLQTVDNGLATSDWSTARQFRIDTIEPVVKNVVITPQTSGIGQVSVVVEFEENFDMDNTVAPVVTFHTPDSIATTITQTTFSGTRWIGVAEVTDGLGSGAAVVRVSGARDALGNVMAANNAAGSFTVDTRRPAVVETYPEADATGIPGNSDIRIVFSEPLDASLVTEDNIKLMRGSVDVPARQNGVSWDSTTNAIIFRPSELRANNPHTVTVVSRIRDVVGNTLDGDYTWNFQTADQVDASDGGLITNGQGTVEIYFAPDAVAGDLQVPITAISQPAGLAGGDHPGSEMNLTYTGIAWQVGRVDSIVTLDKDAVLTIRFDRQETDDLGLDASRIVVLRMQDDGMAFDVDNVIGGTAESIEDLPGDVLPKVALTFSSPMEIKTPVSKLGIFGLFEDMRTMVGDEKLANLRFAPRAFAPAGTHEFLPVETGISFTLGDPSNVSIDVYNIAGRYVRSIADGLPMNAGSQTLSWDGRDGDGRLCPLGLYIVRVRAAGVEKITTVGVVK